MQFFRIFQHLLPRAQAWRITIAKTLRSFFEGLSEEPALVKGFADDVFLDQFAETARTPGALEEWERHYGLTPSEDALIADRRLALAAEFAATGGQSAGYITDVLQAAGFPVVVHEWFEPGTPPYAARNPLDYTTTPRVGTNRCSSFSSQPTCSLFSSQPRCNSFLNNDPGYLVNKDLTRRAPPPIPNDPTKFPYFIYVGGEVFPARATVSATRKDEFERLILRLRPTQNWIVTLIDYEALGGDALITEDGETITTEDDETLAA